MIFRRALLRELSLTGLAVFLVLVSIAVTIVLVRFLGQAAAGSIDTPSVVTLLGFAMLAQLPVLLSLTLFISVLMTLSRLWRDSEMVIWLGSGVGLGAFARPVLLFAVPVVATIIALSTALSPWALSRRDEFRRQLASREELQAIVPGVFRESKGAERVFFVETMQPGQTLLSNIFVHSVQNERPGTMFARHGFQQIAPDGGRWLVLLEGRRYEGSPGSAAFRVTEFERYSMRIQTPEADAATPSVKSLPISELVGSDVPDRVAELSWRVGLPVSAVLLALLAIPLSYVNPRSGRGLNLVLALLVYMIYNNLMSVSQAWIQQQKVPAIPGMWAVHAVALAALVVLYWRRAATIPGRRGR